MLIFRRLFVPLVFSFATLIGQSQSATTANVSPAPVENISLNDAIQRALAKNFSIKVSGFDASIAAAGVTQALGKFDPAINGNYQYSANASPGYTDPNTGLISSAINIDTDTYGLNLGGLLPFGMSYQVGMTSTNTRGTFNNYADNYSTFAGVSGTLPLLRNFGIGTTLASIRIAQVNRGMSEWEFREAVIDTVTNVIFAYNDLNFAYANRLSAIRSRDLALQLVDENQKRFKTGSASQYDVTFANSRAASREENILFAEQAVRQAENYLKQLITDTKTPGLLSEHFTIEPPPPAPVVIVDAAADFREALTKRPDYQQARLALKRDTINRRYQHNQLLPRVDLVGGYGYSGQGGNFGITRQQIENKDYNAYNWGVVVSVPITFTAERGRYRSARLQERKSETLQEQLEQSIVVQVGNAASQIEIVQKRIEATRHARELAQETLDAEKKRLRAGQIDSFFVAQQQEILSGAEVSEARAQSDYHKALAEYDRQLGVTLEKLHISIDPPK
jgi:outer membrane protein TolC